MGLKRLFIDIPVLLESNLSADKIQCEYMYHQKIMAPSVCSK
jgi:hypothetical protein